MKYFWSLWSLLLSLRLCYSLDKEWIWNLKIFPLFRAVGWVTAHARFWRNDENNLSFWIFSWKQYPCWQFIVLVDTMDDYTQSVLWRVCALKYTYTYCHRFRIRKVVEWSGEQKKYYIFEDVERFSFHFDVKLWSTRSLGFDSVQWSIERTKCMRISFFSSICGCMTFRWESELPSYMSSTFVSRSLFRTNCMNVMSILVARPKAFPKREWMFAAAFVFIWVFFQEWSNV